MRIALASFAMLLAFVAPTRAQTTTGTILGTMSDQSDAVLPGATVTITSRDTGISRTVVTAADGSFVVPALPPGSYQLTVSLDGFRPYERGGVTLEVGQNARVDAKLELGSINETITVQGDALHVDTASSSVGVVIDKQRLESLPMNGRGVLSLALLVPGVGASTLPTTVVNQRTGPTIAAGGSRSNQNNIMLDGAQLATSLRNVAGNLPSPDSLQEFQVLTNTYSAEYGRASGATMMAITKSGSNSLSGGAWEIPAQRRAQFDELFCVDQARPRTESVRRAVRRTDQEEPDLLLCQLRGHSHPSRGPVPVQSADRGATGGRFQRRGDADSRPVDGLAVSRQRDSHQPTRSDGAEHPAGVRSRCRIRVCRATR